MRIKSRERLTVTFEASQNLVILGAGSIGTSFAAAFSDVGWRVVVYDPDPVRSQAFNQSVDQQKGAIALAGLARGREEGTIDINDRVEIKMNYSSRTVQSDGENWWIIGSKGS